MTDKTTPPDWAFARAQELRNRRGFTHLDAFAAYIAEHEQPPVPPELRAAREAAGEEADATLPNGKWGDRFRSGEYDDHDYITTALRAIELCDQYRKEAGNV